MKRFKKVFIAIMFLFVLCIVSSCGIKNTPDDPSTLQLKSLATNSYNNYDGVIFTASKNVKITITVKNDYAYEFDNIVLHVSTLNKNVKYKEGKSCDVSYEKKEGEIITTITLDVNVKFDDKYCCNYEIVEINFLDYLGYNMKATLNSNLNKNILQYAYSGTVINGVEFVNVDEYTIDNLSYKIVGNHAVCVGSQDKDIREAKMVSQIEYENYFGKKIFPVTTIEHSAFRECSSLKSIELSCNLISIEEYSFFNCVSLSNIELPDTIVHIGTHTFTGCNKLKYNTYNEGIYLGTSSNPYFALIDITELYKSSYEINQSTVLIASNAFQHCSKATTINIPTSVKIIDSYAFNSCTSLCSINLHDGITVIEERVFSDCTSLDNVKLPNGLKIIKQYTFDGCTSLKQISIPNSVVEISNGAFMSCKSLSTIIIPKSVYKLKYTAFNMCSNLEKIYFEGSIPEWNALTMDSNWNLDENTIIYYYSEEKPTEDECFWHYDNGTVVEW